MSLIIETSLGDLEVDLFVEKAPEISKNFLKLCKLKHYNNALFYEVQKNYLTSIKSKRPTTIQTELSGTESYINDEIDPSKKHNRIGLLSTNNIGQDRNNSEFFITLTNSHLQHFDEKHTIFGQVQVGIEILEKFNTDIIIDSNNLPYINHRILHTFVIDDPFEDPDNLIEPDQSPEPTQKSDNDRLEFHEKEKILNETDKTEEQIIDEAKQQIAKMREIKLQMLGDIPDADMKPPENVLFVCQLNAITQERDLEIIFSRFGVITRCEVVRDWKTGESLSYAFIEFETEKSCQEAYFKMKGALIDERRIHVDFSQSLQKYKNNKRPNNQGNKKAGTTFDNMEFSKFYRNNNYNSAKHKMVFDQGEDDLVETGYRGNKEEKEQQRPNYYDREEQDHKQDRHHHDKKRTPSSQSRERSQTRKKTIKEKKRSSSRDVKRSKSLVQNQSPNRDNKRSKSKDRKKSVSKDRKRKDSKDRKRSKNKDKDTERKRSQSKDKKQAQSKDRKRSRSKDRKRSDRKRSQSKEQKRGGSRSKKRSDSKDKKRSGSRDRKRKNEQTKRSLSNPKQNSRKSPQSSKDKKQDSKRSRSRSQKRKDKKEK